MADNDSIKQTVEVIGYHELMKRTEAVYPSASVPIATYNKHVGHLRMLCQLQARELQGHVRGQQKIGGQA